MQFLDLNWFIGGIRIMMTWLCEFMYRLIAWFFNLFMNVAKVDILSSDQIQPIYQRVTMILTIVMIFYVTFEFVKFVVQPDGITDKEKGVSHIIYKMILVVVLIAFVPSIFTWAYKLQTAIIDKGIIGKVIIGDSKATPDQFGYTFSANLLSLFYGVDEKFANEKCEGITCQTLVQMNLGMLAQTGQLEYLNIGINESKKVESSIQGEKIEVPLINFEFNGLLPVIVGGFVIYILALYCVDLGVRWAQLIFLQIIAPIPIIGYLSPKKDGIFQKWCKQCLTTYLDIFIRVAIMYFILLICSVLMSARSNGNMFANVDSDYETFVYIVLILGVLLFASKAPKLLKELFPSTNAASGNFGLKAGERVAPLAARALGGALGATRAVGGAIARAHNRHARNKANGAKSQLTKEGREQARQRAANRKKAANAGKDTRSAEKARSRVTDEQVAEGKKKVKDAKAELDAAKAKGDKAEIARAEAKLKTEAENYRQLMQQKSGTGQAAEQRRAVQSARKELDAAIASGDQARIQQSEAKLQQATEEYRKAQKSGAADGHLADVKSDASAAGSALSAAKSEAREAESRDAKAQEELKTAEAELQAAKDSGDETKIKEAEANLENKKLNAQVTARESQLAAQKVQDAEATAKEKAKLFKDIAFGGDAELGELRGKHEDAMSQVAEDNNTKYGSALGAGAWGAIAGGVTGAWHGAKATKLEDVWTKAKEGHQADVKNIQALNQYYDNGGNVGFIGGTLDRTVNKIEKSIGMDTAYTRTNLESQSLAADIKKYDETISRADSTKKAFDATEDRIKAKLGESKYTAQTDHAGAIATGLFERDEKTGEYVLDANGNKKAVKLDLKNGQRIADVTRDYKAKASAARATAEQASKQKQDFMAENAALLGMARSSVPADQLARYDALMAEKARLEKQEELATQQATELEFGVTQVEKNASRFLFTQMLKGAPGEYDAVALQNLQDLKESVRIASQDSTIRERLRLMAQAGTITLAEFNAFLSGNFENYDQLDHVNSAVTNAKNEIARRKQGVQDHKTRLESSNLTQAQKAANDAAGGSGK